MDRISYRSLAGVTLALLAPPQFALATFEHLPPFYVVGAVMLLCSALVLTVNRWWAVVPAALLGAVAALHSLVMFPNFQHFSSSVAEFGYVTSCLVLGVLTVGFAVKDLLARRGRQAAVAPVSVLRASTIAVVALIAVITASGVLTVAGRDTVSASEREGAIVIRYKDVAVVREDQDVTAPTGQPVRIVIDNKDFGFHNFQIDGTDVDVDLSSKESKLVEVSLEAGTYTFKCTVPGHDNMKGTITVQ